MFEANGISLSENISDDLNNICKNFLQDKVFILLDENTSSSCRQRFGLLNDIPDERVLVIKSGEENKNLEQVEAVWRFLGENMADRKSLLINIGGGMLTDLGGFAASGFKRGIQFVNVPTTILAMVDASVGGKTGINFRGLKNEIGFFSNALHVFLFPPFLETLDDENYRSGFAEMIKTALIADKDLWNELKSFNLERKDIDLLSPLLWRSVMIKKEIVENDPNENGVRKALNFGHTVAHALESIALSSGNEILHGYAVAYGMQVEARLSVYRSELSESDQEEIFSNIKRIYGELPEQLFDHERLIKYMRFDKKNEGNQINFTLLNKIGSFTINNYLNEEEIILALHN